MLLVSVSVPRSLKGTGLFQVATWSRNSWAETTAAAPYFRLKARPHCILIHRHWYHYASFIGRLTNIQYVHVRVCAHRQACACKLTHQFSSLVIVQQLALSMYIKHKTKSKLQFIISPFSHSTCSTQVLAKPN